jgi:hypothetical protein
MGKAVPPNLHRLLLEHGFIGFEAQKFSAWHCRTEQISGVIIPSGGTNPDIPTGFVGFPYTFLVNENRSEDWGNFVRKSYLSVFQALTSLLGDLLQQFGT